MNRAAAFQEQAFRVGDQTMTRQAMIHLMSILRRLRRYGFDTSSWLYRMQQRGVLKPQDMGAARYLEKAVLAEGPEFDPVMRQRYQDARMHRHQEREQRRRERGSALAKHQRDEYVYVGAERREQAR